jgi:hypothetical protein
MFRAGFRAEAAKPVKRRCYLRKHRVTPCRKQRCAPFPARLEPPGATRGPALLPSPELPWDSEQEPGCGRRPPRTTLSPALRPSGSMSFVSRVRAIARPGPKDRAGPSAPTTGDYVNGMPGYTVPDPTPRSTRTDPGPLGHVRRESRLAWGGEGGGRAASLEPSAGACALSEPDSLGDGASSLLQRRIAQASMPPIPQEAFGCNAL